jgi:signal transduction histidine kinase
MYKIFLLFSIVIIFILLLIIVSMNRKLKYIKIVLDDVLSGNINRRVMLNNNVKAITDLVNNINGIVDNMCEIENEKVKKTNMMSRMISNISHDFKTPLTSLIGYIELIKESNGLSIEELREYLDIVHNKAYYLNSTLDNFFYLAKLESSDEKFNIEEINLTDAIQEQIVFFYNDFQNLGIMPAIDMPEDDIFVLADKISIKRILNNLLSNSLKYGKDGNKIGISTKENSEYIYIEVWDNGKGISDQDLPLIFERLYTVEGSRSVKLSGTGIGLSIVKELVKNNKGSISVESIPFEKTSFIFSLPKSRRTVN